MKSILLFAMLSCFAISRVLAQQPVVITYVGGYRGNLVDTRKIQANKLTHLLYAFADVSNSKAFLNYPKTDAVNLKNLVKLRSANRKLKILLSVGGLGWSRNFSTMAMTETGRQTFTKSCVSLVQAYRLDGIDIDWEFPGYPGEGGNKYRPVDKQNYTLLFKALRDQFDKLQKKTGMSYQITAAVDGWAPHFLPHTEMNLVQQYVNFICLMAYNFNTKELVGGHYLYAPEDWDTIATADGAVKAFIRAGVPANKLVSGAGFFPAAFQMVTSNPVDRRYRSKIKFREGLARVNRMIDHHGFKKYAEEKDHAPYLFNSQTKIRISYEDTSLIRAKCAYIKTNGLAGIMYWDYFSDPGKMLLNTIVKSFK